LQDGEEGMAKIILSLDDSVLKELVLSKETTRIGRHSHNDLVIENRAVSGEHAIIVMRAQDVILEDLNSTNGTLVNGQPIKKHYLKDNDVIELARYRVVFLSEKKVVAVKKPQAVLAVGAASIKILTGGNAGKQLMLSKPLTTIGKPGVQVAVIAQRADGYYLTHVEGAVEPSINGISIGSEAQILLDGDVIDVAGIHMGFAWRKG
jgi:pSer/pThr/pTyr-binding forkhead associated (FHA) protein